MTAFRRATVELERSANSRPPSRCTLHGLCSSQTFFGVIAPQIHIC